MKKVGIATMFGGANYGNILQNYAVEQLIRDCGYNPYTLQNLTKVGFIDYSWREMSLSKKLCPTYIKAYIRVMLENKFGCKNDRDFTLKNLLKYKKNIDDYKTALESRFKRFDNFRNEYLNVDSTPITAQWYDKVNIDTFTAFVCGSDQVWNPYYKTTSSVDFLQFAPPYKRIALSPSFGVSKIPDARKKDYTDWISKIPYLSVRENAGAEIIKELTGKDATVLIDPTLCITADKWLSLAKEPKHKPKKDFVFCYFLGNKSKKYCRYIEKYAKQNNYEIVNVCDVFDLRYYDCDPNEFLWLLSHAKAVFTDSFHGMAFSINLQVPFVVFDRVERGSSMSSRIATILKKTELDYRHYLKVSFDDVEKVDFSRSEEVLKSEREKEIEFLQNALLSVEKESSIYLTNKYHCTGCGACYNTCPVGAITMVSDEEGFLYPEINNDKCIKCHACENACPADRVKASDELPPAYAAFSKDNDIQAKSSSGGVFTHIARNVLSLGGVVFGAAYDENFNVCHIAVDNENDLQRLRTSKYVQSDIKLTYKQAKDYLKNGKTVLFTGTPCQIAGLKQFLQKDYDNLYTQDIICHGVPSPDAFNEYLNTYHRKKGIKSISFRDKTKGWNDFSMRVEYIDGSIYRELATKDPFERAFLANLNLRPSCYQCQYKTASRMSDITLADYWGVEVVHPELKDVQGVSLVLTHSQKGEKLLKEIEADINIVPTNSEKAIGMNSAARHSVACPPQREAYFNEYKQTSMCELVNRLLKKTFMQKLKRFIRVNGSRVKRLLRKIKVVGAIYGK